VTYLLTRLFAAAMYWVGARRLPTQLAALFTFLPLSLLAPLVVVAGACLEGGWRIGAWVGAIVVDMASAARAGRGTWEVDPGHFAERNGLFVLIALGESIVAIGLGASRTEGGAEVVITLALAFAGAAVLWWSYFDRAARAAEGYLRSVTGRERGRFARDAYTLLHIPAVLGIVLYAVAAESVVAHPGQPLPTEFRFALAAGMSLVLLAVVAGTYRATRRIPQERLVAALILIGLATWAGGIRADLLTAVVVAIVAAALWRERKRRWPRPQGTS
jgi:low temperature requirement protein LtrA